jgi:hypothetical protein
VLRSSRRVGFLLKAGSKLNNTLYLRIPIDIKLLNMLSLIGITHVLFQSPKTQRKLFATTPDNRKLFPRQRRHHTMGPSIPKPPSWTDSSRNTAPLAVIAMCILCLRFRTTTFALCYSIPERLLDVSVDAHIGPKVLDVPNPRKPVITSCLETTWMERDGRNLNRRNGVNGALIRSFSRDRAAKRTTTNTSRHRQL